MNSDAGTSIQTRLAQKFASEDKKIIPKEKGLILVGCFLVMQFFNFGKGTKEVPSFFGIKGCSSQYWLLFWLQIVFVVSYEFIIYFYLRREHRMKVENNYDFD